MLLHRILSAAVALPVVLAAIWLGGVPFTLFVGGCAAVAAWEYFGIAGRDHRSPLVLAGVLLAVLFVVNAHFGEPFTSPLLAIALLLTLSGRLLVAPPAGALADWSVIFGGALYTGWLLGYFVLLRQLPDGLWWTLYTALVTFAVDAGAYGVGSWVGRRRLAPLVSPGKSLEGATAGLVSGAVAGAVLAGWLHIPLGLLPALGLGLLVAAAAQVGDLVESMLKRSAQVKDASRLIPGHGGLLDRADSLVFAGVVVYYFARWAVGLP